MSTPTQPDYISQDQKEREAFLSQLGTFSPSEREVFHKLCKIWTGQISYTYALTLLSSDSATAKSDLENLLGKLRGQRVAVLTSTISEGIRSPSHIIMRNRDDTEIFMYLVDEYLLDIVGDITTPLPSPKSLQEKGIVIPNEQSRLVDYPTIAQLYNAKTPPEPELLRVPGPAPHELYVVSTSIKRFLTLALAKLHNYFQNGNFLAAIAQMRNTSIMELKKQLASKDTSFWQDIAAFMLAVQKDLMALRRLTIDPGLFQLAFFIKSFLAEQMLEFKKRKEAEEQRSQDMKALVEKVRSSIMLMVSEQDFAESLIFFKPKYGDGFPSFKEDFQKTYMDAPLGKNLPIIVKVGTLFIHMENIPAWFNLNITKIGRELLAYYVHAMESYIKRPSEPGFECFYSQVNFEDDILDKIKVQSQPLADLLDRPNLVAEAMIYSVKKNKDVRSADELKSALSAYFYTDRIRFKYLSIILGLNLVEIYRIAFMKMGIIRQFILKMTGKNESFLKKFSGFVMEDSNIVQQIAPMENNGRSNSAKDRYEERRRKEMSVIKKADKKLGGKPAQGKIPKAPPKARTYSPEERNSAWDQFGKTIKK